MDYYFKNEERGAGPVAQAVKCTRSAAAARGSLVRIPGAHQRTALAGHAVAASHIKWRRMGTDVSPGPSSSAKKEEDWRLLAQG